MSNSEFFNPYNFIRSSESDVREKPIFHNETKGYSGEVTVSATAITPLFIGGRREITDDGHHLIYFYEENKQKTIPSTSLKGMLRSYFEAITNSCYLSLEKNYYEGYRPKLGKMGINADLGRIEDMPSQNNSGTILLGETFKMTHVVMDIYKETLRNIGINRWKQGSYGPIFVEFEPDKELPDKILAGKTENSTCCYLKVSGAMGTKKHETAVTFDKISKELEFPNEVLIKYNAVYAHRKNQDNNPVKLSEGDLVYIEYSGNVVTNIYPAKHAKKPYNRSVSEVICSNESRKPCDLTDFKEGRICPACRIFGNIFHNIDSQSNKKVQGFAGRLFVSQGKIKDQSDFTQDLNTLKILGSPHPSCIPFYMQESKDIKSGYEGTADIRGRKFYHHHKSPDYRAMEKSNQNATVYHIMNAGNSFTFKIRYEGLSDFELGALLFLLNNNKDQVLKLGMGKPIGLGSIHLNITSMVDINKRKRYSDDLSETGVIEWSQDEIDMAIICYKEALLGYEKEYDQFDQIPYIEDFLIISDTRKLGKYPVKYPRANGKGFSWFMDFTDVNKHKDIKYLPQLSDIPKKKLDGWS